MVKSRSDSACIILEGILDRVIFLFIILLNMRKYSSLLLFLVGLGSVTQFHFVGSIGLSELPMFLLAPIVFLIDFRQLKEDGFLPFVCLSILTCFGCMISSMINKTPSIIFIKGLANPYSIFAATVILHRLLRSDFNGFKYFLIGSFLSGIISIFIFQQETFTVHHGELNSGDAATEMVMSYPLFWSGKIKQLLSLPSCTHYLSLPLSYSVFACLISAFVFLLYSGSSGRAAALATFASAVLLLVFRKSRRQMLLMGRHVIMLGLAVVLSLMVFKFGYSFAASSGFLGYDVQQKYLSQTRMGSGALQMLMAGRMEFFCGVMACLDHPIVGFGPKGEDTEGYVERYLQKYGAPEDYTSYVNYMYRVAREQGYVYKTIPAHSYIGMFWIYYGIFGLIIWIYVLCLFYLYLRKYASSIPQWFGYIAWSMPALVWDIFFSPYGGRVSGPSVVVCILFAKAVFNRRIRLPYEMELEAQKYE